MQGCNESQSNYDKNCLIFFMFLHRFESFVKSQAVHIIVKTDDFVK